MIQFVQRDPIVINTWETSCKGDYVYRSNRSLFPKLVIKIYVDLESDELSLNIVQNWFLDINFTILGSDTAQFLLYMIKKCLHYCISDIRSAGHVL